MAIITPLIHILVVVPLYPTAIWHHEFTGGLGAARTTQAASGFSPTGALLSGLAGNQQFTSGVGN